MKYVKRALILLILSGFGTILYAQENLATSGGKVEGIGGSLYFTVGQLLYTSSNDFGEGSLHEGVQLPYEITAISGSDIDINLEYKAYPNPLTDSYQLNLLIPTSENLENMTYKLFSSNGSLLALENFSAKKIIIPMKDYKPGTFILKIISGNLELKTFKIVKK